MIAIPLSEFLTDWIVLIQSFRLSFERCSNFLKQNIGFCKICLQDWLICAQIFKSSTSKFQKTFSARCWRPGLLMICSIPNEICENTKTIYFVRLLLFFLKIKLFILTSYRNDFRMFWPVLVIMSPQCCSDDWLERERPIKRQILTTLSDLEIFEQLLCLTWNYFMPSSCMVLYSRHLH